jgi:hypothetical protein
MKLKSILLLLIIASFYSCGAYLNKHVNPYHFGMQTYNSQKLKKAKDVKIYDYNETNLQYFIKQGYKIKAKSAFRERYVHLDWAKLASKQLGTPVMLLRNDYVGSVSGRRTLAFTIPGEKYIVTSETNANLNYNSTTDAYAISDYGYATGSSTTSGNANYNSQTKTTIQGPDKYGYKTVRYENHYYDYYAVFLVKDANIEKEDVPKKFIKRSRLKYSTGSNLKVKPDFHSTTIKEVSQNETIYILKQSVKESNWDKVFVSGHTGYLLSKLIE